MISLSRIFFKKLSHIRRLWLDLGDLGRLVYSKGPHEQWQDHGLGLLRTILHQHGIMTDLHSTRACTSWEALGRRICGYDMLIMNVRSYTYPVACRAAKLFKEINPRGIVIVGGMHASVAPNEMISVKEFDKICQGAGEKIIVDLVRDPSSFPRVIHGIGAKSMADWPMIDRTLWPKPVSKMLRKKFNWPLEPECGWGPPAVATILTSRICPWNCVFCNENSYITNITRKPVEMVIDELNFLDKKYGPVGSVVIHDSLFFQNRRWLEEWLEKYPAKTRNPWPYWAAGRSDTVRKWPELFTSLIRDTNWRTVSIGFESGSDRVLRILNKECTEEDNYFTIELVNKIGDDLERSGDKAPVFWANIMLGIPGETREDAFKTMFMLKQMRRVMASVAFFAPYPGSALGYQLIAEGKSLMMEDNYHRYPNDEKVKGIDYRFYQDLVAGKYEGEINRILRTADSRMDSPPEKQNTLQTRSHMYLFSMRNGKKKLAYGNSPTDALNILSLRLSREEMQNIIPLEYSTITSKKILDYVDSIG